MDEGSSLTKGCMQELLRVEARFDNARAVAVVVGMGCSDLSAAETGRWDR